jgi:hypothetical protein
VPLTTAYRTQVWADNPHLLSHEYRLVLLQHLGAQPVRLQRLATLASRSPAGINALGEPVSAAAEVVGAGYTAGGLPVTVTVDVVDDTSRLLFTAALWNTITADIRGAILVNKTLEDAGTWSILGWLDAAELITRTAEPLRVSVLDGVFAVLPSEGATGTVTSLSGDVATTATSVTPGTITAPDSLLLDLDWLTLGTSQGARWNTTAGPANGQLNNQVSSTQLAEVVPITSATGTVPVELVGRNALNVGFQPSTPGGSEIDAINFERVNLVAPGQSYWLRMYVNNLNEPVSGTTTRTHFGTIEQLRFRFGTWFAPIEYAGAGWINDMYFYDSILGGGSYPLGVPPSDSNMYKLFHLEMRNRATGAPLYLDFRKWYRMEWHWEVLSFDPTYAAPMTGRWHSRIYDAVSGALVADDDDYFPQDYVPGGSAAAFNISLAELYAAGRVCSPGNPTLPSEHGAANIASINANDNTFDLAPVSTAQEAAAEIARAYGAFSIGNNGPLVGSGGSGMPGHLYARAAVSTTGWIGAAA